MQIPNRPIDLPAAEGLLLERAVGRSEGLLQRLQQQGSFRAEVVRAEGQRVLLETAFGALRGEQGSSALAGRTPRLQPGDVIEARIDRSGPQPRLNIQQHQPLQVELRQTVLSRMLQQAPHRLLAARIATARDPGQNLLQIGRQQFAIPRDSRLQHGDTVILRPGERPGEIRLQRVQPRPLLLQALSRLIPKQGEADAAPGGSLARLQQLARQLLPPNASPAPSATARSMPLPPGPAAPASPPPAATTRADTASPMPPANKPNTAEITTAPAARASVAGTRSDPLPVTSPPSAGGKPQASVGKETGGEPPPRLQNLLQALMKLAIQPSRLSPQQLQSSLAQLGLLGGGGQRTGLPASSNAELLPRLIELQALLRDQPELFERLLRGHFNVQAGSAQAAAADTADNAAELLQWRQQFSQQLDQSINQLLLGKTGLRLQQDQQQPLNLNLVLPLQLPDEPQRELKLRLRQRPNAEEPEQPAWDVRLSFEFGLLGMITVHVLLQDTRISAHFWAVEEDTWRRIDAELPSFKQQLQRSGFELGLFDCFQGQPKTDDPDSPQVGEGNLLDVEA